MRRARIVLLALAVLATGPLAAAPAGAEPVARAAAACAKPHGLSFKRTTGRSAGVLRWRAARGASAYRVTRNGRVVGQTRRRALRVPVRIGRTYRLAVVPLTAAGTPARCAASKRVRVRWRAPGAPRALAVSNRDGALQLDWLRARRGDGKLAGYRVLRDGAPLAQTRLRSWKLGLVPNRPYRFTVVAVDTRGRTSRPSNVVDARVGHTPPTTPRGVEAMAVSESEVGVRWQASRTGSGRIAGYRVLRDGVVVSQVPSTSAVLTNLAPSTDYGVSVVAVDSLGYASAPSASVSVRTQDPVPTGGHAHAYLLASTDHSFADFRAHYRQIGVLYPTYFDCRGSDLALIGQDDPLVTRWAQARKVLVMPRINCQGTTKVHRLLTDPTLRGRWLDQLAALAPAHGYDGLSIDFEAGPASDREALSTFVEELAARLHAQGRRLTIAASAKTYDSLTHPRSGIFDYPRLARAADWVFVMAWGLHWATSAPGPQDDAAWATRIADYVASMPQPRRFVYGTNLYAMDWPNGGGAANEATAYQYGEMMPLLASHGAAGALDPAADNFHAAYVDGAGTHHDVWYPDAGTTSRRLALAASRGFGGVGFWRLGLEDQRVWDDPRLAPGAPW